MKKVLLLTGIIMLVFVLVACGGTETVEVTTPDDTTVNATVEEPTEDVVEAPTDEPVLQEEIPNYLFTRPDGETFNLHDYKGKIVILNFWASW